MKYLIDLCKTILKFTWKGKGIIIAETILKKNTVGRISLPNLETYYIPEVIKTEER